MERISIPAKPQKLLSCGICLGVAVLTFVALELWGRAGLSRRASELEAEITAFEKRRPERLFPDQNVEDGNASHDYGALAWVLGWYPDWGNERPSWLPETELPRDYQGSDLHPLREIVAGLEPGAPLEAEVEALLSEYGSLLPHVAQGTRRKVCIWEIANLREGPRTRIPNLLAARYVSELLFLEAHRSGPEAALQHGRTMLAFGRDIALVPGLIGQLGYSIEELGLECLRRQLPALDGPSLESLALLLATCPAPDPGYNMTAERLWQLAWFAQQAGHGLTDAVTDPDDAFELGPRRWLNLWMQLEWRELATGLEKWYAPVGQPRAMHASLLAEAQAWQESCWGSSSRVLHFNAPRLLDAAAALLARYRCLAVLVASELYLREHEGAWPPGTGALLPYLADKLPEDPFGEALRLGVQDGRLVAYSVGPDGTDDSGAIAEDETGHSLDVGWALPQR